MNEALSDSQLLALSAEGDRGAFGILMDRHTQAVYRYLLSLEAGADDAEDALQECFVSAWQNAGQFRGEGPARGWLFTIARRALFRLTRKRAGEPKDVDPLDKLSVKAGWGSRVDFRDRFEAKEAVEWGLSKLPFGEREAVVLRDLTGLSGAETADVMGVSIPAMKSTLHRGRLRLMGYLKEGVPGV